MKKYFLCMICLVFLFGIMSSRTTVLKAENGSDGIGDCVVNIKLDGSNPSDLKTGEKYTVYAFFSKLESSVDTLWYEVSYDKNILEPVIDECEGIGEWTGTANISGDGEFLVSLSGPSTFKDVDVNICKMVFNVLTDTDNTKIQLVNVNPASLGKDYYSDGVSNMLMIGAPVSNESTKVVFNMQSQIASTGSDIIVPVNFTQNDGFNTLGITLTYDNTIMDYVGMVLSDQLSDKICLKSINSSASDGEVKASFIALEDVKDTGRFLNVFFHIKGLSKEGDVGNVQVQISQITILAETNVIGEGSVATITIGQNVLLGDVNLDKTIDLIDAAYILQYYNSVRTLSSEQLKNADVNCSGTVNLVDALMILKFYNGEISTFY